MAVPVGADEDLINFDIIETHKENIQSLPGGRSAKQLASILAPLPSGRATGANAAPTLNETKTLNDAIRQEYEIELQSIADSDDPLDIFDRYVKWTLNAYPSAQATPQSQLLPLLERATKTFLTSSHYKNDPRYLKLWLHYIRLFSDSPRETFAFLARHGIGEGLGLFYEEFASWFEGVGRWVQADEVYRLGIEREARPAERLLRKYNQFQQRFNSRTPAENEPSSPALPTVRPALAAKIDPFASASRGADTQTARQQNAAGGSSAPTARSGKPKMAIFSDTDGPAAPTASMASNTAQGWDSIGSMKERKKENTIEARPWAGEKLKGGSRVGTVPRMEIFKDPAIQAAGHPQPKKRTSNAQSSKQPADVVNPRTGRSERVFVRIEAVYPPGTDQELSFEELRALSRGWSKMTWGVPSKVSSPHSAAPLRNTTGNAADQPQTNTATGRSQEPEDVENLSISFQQKIDLNNSTTANLSIHDVSTQSMVGMPESELQPRSQTQSQNQKQKERRSKIREVKQETQTVKTRLESPTGRKLKRKNSSTAEPTMTFHSKAATNDIYDMFNQPLRRPQVEREDTQSGDDADFTEGEVDDGYSTTGDGESTGTGRVSGAGSEFGDDTLASLSQNQSTTQPESVSPWSDFSTSKHVPRLASSTTVAGKNKHSAKTQARADPRNKHQMVLNDEMTENIDSSSQNHTLNSGSGDFDTQAIAAIANANFDDMDTKAIAMIAGDVDDEDDGEVDEEEGPDTDEIRGAGAGLFVNAEPQHTVEDCNNKDPDDNVSTPVDDVFTGHREIPNTPLFVPIPPEDYEPTPMRPFRDPAFVAQNKLPFMTPIVERTESSLAPSTIFNDPDYFNSKTPSRSAHGDYDSPSKLTLENLLMSSPQQADQTPSSSAKRKFERTRETAEEVTSSSPRQKKILGLEQKTSPVKIKLDETSVASLISTAEAPAKAVVQAPVVVRKGPIVADLQCNPCDDAIRQQVLNSMHPPLSSYVGYHDHSTQVSNHFHALKSFAEKMAKTKTKASPRKSQNEKTLTKAVPPILRFTGSTRIYAVKRELGQGAFAPVYLAESYDPEDTGDVNEEASGSASSRASTADSNRQSLEALKTESPPGTLVWEFHILRLVRQRLGYASRSMQSIVLAHECHLYRDEAYIVLSYSPQGTLLDLVNLARSENVKCGKIAEGLDETLAMWFSVELLRTLEDLHRVGILHGDLKGDNCLVRFDPAVEVSCLFNPEGKHGWDAKGLKVIDFGRGIDTRVFQPAAQFIADWPSCAQDCAEIRDCRPWKWQIDYHGAAGVIHSLLFGKYIETIPAASSGLGPGQKKEWRLKDNLKRYWEKDLWTEVFAVLLNPCSVADKEEMPIQGNLRAVRMKMEKWLMDEGERGGRDLRGALRKMERLVCVK